MSELSNRTWDARYLNLAKDVSEWSKDPSTKVGAVIVGDKHQIVSQGYNGFPRGFKDSLDRLESRLNINIQFMPKQMPCIMHSITVHASMAVLYMFMVCHAA